MENTNNSFGYVEGNKSNKRAILLTDEESSSYESTDEEILAQWHNQHGNKKGKQIREDMTPLASKKKKSSRRNSKGDDTSKTPRKTPKKIRNSSFSTVSPPRSVIDLTAINFSELPKNGLRYSEIETPHFTEIDDSLLLEPFNRKCDHDYQDLFTLCDEYHLKMEQEERKRLNPSRILSQEKECCKKHG